MSRSILTVIPARGGSKGVKRKNLRPLLGKPLIFYGIEAARNAKSVDRLIVSTDDEEIAAYARSQGVEVPFLRPAELANDRATLVEVMRHALHFFDDAGERFEAVMSIQGTTPALKSASIDAVADKFYKTGADAVVTVAEVAQGHPLICKKLVGANGDQLESYFELPPNMVTYPRQVREPAYYPNGAVFLRDRKLLDNLDRATNGLGFRPRAVLMDREESINIDEPFDLAVAELILSIRKPQR